MGVLLSEASGGGGSLLLGCVGVRLEEVVDVDAVLVAVFLEEKVLRERGGGREREREGEGERGRSKGEKRRVISKG